MSVGKPFDGEVIESIGFVTLSSGGVDRSKWQFDQDGFSQATSAAKLKAAQLLADKIKTVHQDFVSINHPVDYDVTVGGVPIDKARMQR
jgi:hypothetical protein